VSIRSDAEDLNAPASRIRSELRRPSLLSRAASFITGRPPVEPPEAPAVPVAAPDPDAMPVSPAAAAVAPGGDDEILSPTIEVRRQKWSIFDEAAPGGINPTAKKWAIRDGYTITTEPRLPEDGDAPFRFVDTPPPTTGSELKPKVFEGESMQQLRQRGAEGKLSGTLRGKNVWDTAQPTDPGFRSFRDSGSFGGFSRNRGTIRWDGEITEQ